MIITINDQYPLASAVDRPKRHFRDATFQVEAGDDPYVAGGYSITALAASLNLNTVDKVVCVEADGYLPESVYASSAWKVKINNPTKAAATHTHTTPAHAHDLLVKGGQAAASTAALAHYATDILGKEAATDATITGADSATKGGVQSGGSGTSGAGGAITAAAGTEYSGNLVGLTFRCHIEGT